MFFFCSEIHRQIKKNWSCQAAHFQQLCYNVKLLEGRRKMVRDPNYRQSSKSKLPSPSPIVQSLDLLVNPHFESKISSFCDENHLQFISPLLSTQWSTSGVPRAPSRAAGFPCRLDHRTTVPRATCRGGLKVLLHCRRLCTCLIAFVYLYICICVHITVNSYMYIFNFFYIYI